MPSTLSKFLAGVVFLLVCAVGVLAYYLQAANKLIAQHEARVTQLQQEQQAAAEAIAKLDFSSRELRTQLSVVRVALQQSTSIRVDASGAIITKRGTRPDGIELR